MNVLPARNARSASRCSTSNKETVYRTRAKEEHSCALTSRACPLATSDNILLRATNRYITVFKPSVMSHCCSKDKKMSVQFDRDKYKHSFHLTADAQTDKPFNLVPLTAPDHTTKIWDLLSTPEDVVEDRVGGSGAVTDRLSTCLHDSAARCNTNTGLQNGHKKTSQ
ncbi:uncharacterized protein LOC144027166 [Festucalex cinctus]